MIPTAAHQGCGRASPGRSHRSFRIHVIAFVALIVAATAPQTIAADWADPAKVLRIAFPIDVSGLDPAATQETYASLVEGRIFDALYVWDYLARPYKFVPSIAAGMPEISADGRVWTIRIRQGIYFADDPAFGGKKRELTAADYVYAWKRIVDPRVRSPNSDLLEGKIVELDEAIAKAKSSGRFDYDAEIKGLRAIDRYTLRIELVQPDYTFLEILDSASLRAVAREVIEKYRDESGRVQRNPVGTGPYRLKEWTPGRRIVLEANTAYRDERFPPAPANADAGIKAIYGSMKGKRLPQIGRIEIAIIEETNPRLLMFDAGQLDILEVPSDVAPKMIDSKGNLLPQYAARGMRLERATELGVTFGYFNMEDPVVGGYTSEKIALRRAICSAYNVPDDIRVIRNGQALPATQPIPPDVDGHVRGYNGLSPYDPATARALLDKFGYKDRDGDGLRELPDGKPLTIHQNSLVGAAYRQFDDLWQRSMREVGIRMDFQIQTFPEAFKAARAGHIQFGTFGWSGDIADDFLRIFYGPYAGAGNLSRFRNAEYDALYEKSRRTADAAERDRIYESMTNIISAQAPWCMDTYRISSTVVAPQVRGYRKNPHYFLTPWEYLDIDTAAQKMTRR
ncbi:MAG TPA: ABC transporter substrate-binding protein [Casimicrobiaceae bacterium]|nr:ABC transporter substrate-binding protein [Casimicrobiaceae bacterium]